MYYDFITESWGDERLFTQVCLHKFLNNFILKYTHDVCSDFAELIIFSL